MTIYYYKIFGLYLFFPERGTGVYIDINERYFFKNLIFSKKGNISGKIGFRGERIYIKCRHSIYIAPMSTRRGTEFISVFPLQFNKKWLRWCLYALSKTYLNVLFNKLYENMRCKNRVDFRSMYVFSLKKSSRISIHRWIQL